MRHAALLIGLVRCKAPVSAALVLGGAEWLFREAEGAWGVQNYNLPWSV